MILAFNIRDNLLFQGFSNNLQMTGMQIGYTLAFETFDTTFVGVDFAMFDIHESQAHETVFMFAAEADESVRVIPTSFTFDVFVSAVSMFESPLHS